MEVVAADLEGDKALAVPALGESDRSRLLGRYDGEIPPCRSVRYGVGREVDCVETGSVGTGTAPSELGAVSLCAYREVSWVE